MNVLKVCKHVMKVFMMFWYITAVIRESHDAREDW